MHYFNVTYRRSGTLREGRYRATMVDSERYLLTLMRYIELNPVRTGQVAHPQDYPGSSYRRNALGMTGLNSDWLRSHEEYSRLARDEAQQRVAYQQLIQITISNNDLSEIRECAHKGWALGGDRFREQIEMLGKRRATSKGAGRSGEKRNRNRV